MGCTVLEFALRRHVLKTRVDSYILGALSSWLPFVVASSVFTDE
jgi:hypothetical protein